MRDMGFKVDDDYKYAFSLLAALLDKTQVRVLKQAISMLVVAYGLADKFPHLVEAECTEVKDPSPGTDKGHASTDASPVNDEHPPVKSKPRKPRKMKPKRKKP